ncbi:MAG: T9SS type A sorting domain-containing protein [Bacteroidaceae bacterium]|nr:T9SS type A sorting domain-containing protein [Bacteroidaceae bacterium]
MKHYYSLVLLAAMTLFPSMVCAQLSKNTVYERLIARQNVDGYREGEPWNNSNVYVNTVEFFGYPAGYYTGIACFGFMMDMMEYASNYEYPIREIEGSYDNIPEIRVGDGVRVNNDGHSVVVLEVEGSVITVAEGNYNRSVHWGRKIDLADPNVGFSYIATFWPEGSTGFAYNEFKEKARDISISNLSGILVKEVAQTNQPARTLLNDLPKGTYIVKEGTKTYKIFNSGK